MVINKTKPTEQDLIEANNLIEQASEVFDKCTNCGMCKGICPAFKVLKEERVSPRGQGNLLSRKLLDKMVYQCTLCRACETRCPINIEVCDAVLMAREALVLKGEGMLERDNTN